jgi:restriction endonuclease S subunit
VDRHITVLRLKEDYDPYFVTYFLRSDFGKVQFEKYWVGSSGQIEVWPVDMGQFIIPKNTKNGIPYERQKEIAESITKSLKRTRELEENRKQLISRAFQIFDTFVQENSQSGLSPAS